MRKIVVASQKGGTGKTTCAVNLCGGLAAAGKKPLLIDLDPQGSASLAWLGLEDRSEDFAAAFRGEKDLVGLIQKAGSFDVVGSGLGLIGAERSMISEPGGDLILRGLLEKLPRKWDPIVIDTPPSLGPLTVNALSAGTEVLVPVELSALSFAALEILFRTVETVRERLNPELRILGLLPCRVDLRTVLHREAVGRLKESFNGKLLETRIRQRISVSEATGFGKSLLEYDPEGPGAADFQELVREIIERGKA